MQTLFYSKAPPGKLFANAHVASPGASLFPPGGTQGNYLDTMVEGETIDINGETPCATRIYLMGVLTKESTHQGLSGISPTSVEACLRSKARSIILKRSTW